MSSFSTPMARFSTPEIGASEIMRYVDRRFLKIDFKYPTSIIEKEYPSDRNIVHNFDTFTYNIAHESFTNKIIYKTIQLPVRIFPNLTNIKCCLLYIANKKIDNETNEYYLCYELSEFKTPLCTCRSECGYCYEEALHRDFTYEYVSDKLDDVIFMFMDIPDYVPTSDDDDMLYA